MIRALQLKMENANCVLNFLHIVPCVHRTHHVQLAILALQLMLEDARNAKIIWFIAANARVKQLALPVLILMMLVQARNALPVNNLSFMYLNYASTIRTVFPHTKPQAML